MGSTHQIRVAHCFPFEKQPSFDLSNSRRLFIQIIALLKLLLPIMSTLIASPFFKKRDSVTMYQPLGKGGGSRSPEFLVRRIRSISLALDILLGVTPLM